MKTALEMKRNVAIIAQGDAGKTTLAEAMLFSAKATKKLGRVDDGDSVFDFEPEEQKRKITISTALGHYEWDKHRVNILDTPGYSNFLVETRNALRVAEGAIVVLSAVGGIKVQTEVVCEYADESRTSRIAFVNNMDRERADFKATIKEFENILETKALPIQMPIGEGEDFKGVVDLLTMTSYIYDKDCSGGFKTATVEGADKEAAEKMREAMVESLVETDDALTEKYLNGEEVSLDELRKGLRDGVLAGDFVPVLCGSAYNLMGVNLLMDAVNAALPSPVEGAGQEELGKDATSGEELTLKPSTDGPFAALVFKTVIDPYTGKLSYFRIFSGLVTGDSTVANPGRDTKEKLSHIFEIEGKKTTETTEAGAGDIVAVSKLKDTHTGDTLCDPSSAVVLTGFPPTNAPLSLALNPKNKNDEDKVPTGIAKLIEEDPSLKFRMDTETQDFIISGVGQVHLEVAIEKLKRKYGCEVELTVPTIPYKETIRAKVQVQGKYKKQSGGRGQYGDTWMEISPRQRGSGFEFENKIVGGAIPRQYIPAVEKGVKGAMETGMLAGYPVVDIKVRLYDGSHHSVDSSEMAFKIAGSMGFKKGMEQARPVLLEPIMNVEITVPDDSMGDVIGDLNSKRGKVQGVEPKKGNQSIKAQAPMSEIINYANDLKGLTGDRGIFTMDFSHYDELPAHLSDKIIANKNKEKE